MVPAGERHVIEDDALPANLLLGVFDAAFVGMLIVDARGRVALANDAAARMMGYASDEMRGLGVESFIPERFREAHAQLRESYGAAANARPLTSGGDFYALRKDGSEFPVQIGLQPIGGAARQLVLTTIVDNSERRRLQDRFRLVVESAPNAIVMVNGSGVIVLVNTQAERVFGYTAEQLLGKSVETLVPARYRNKHPWFRRSFIERPDARPMGAGRDLYALRADASEFPVEIGLVPLDTEEGPMVLCAIVDITERKHREERIEAALREKDLLLGEVHHRVKNNLQVVDSLLSLQSRRVSDPEVHAALRDSQNRIRSLSFIHQTLYQSHDFAFVDFHAFLGNLLPRLLESIALDPGRVKIEFDAQQVQLPINLAIPCGLIVNELVTNALKHAFPEGRDGRIRVELTREPKGSVMMAISNDGVVLPPGFSLEGTSGQLGMQLVTLLAQQVGARVQVIRGPETRFVVRFPST